MKKSIKEITEILKNEFSAITFCGPDCRNHRPGTGWRVVGNGAFTRAIRAAGLPNANFWSGSAPTPSTQAPEEIVNYCYNNFI